jgi:hypothetical protein
MDWRCASGGRVSALQVNSNPSPTRKKKKNEELGAVAQKGVRGMVIRARAEAKANCCAANTVWGQPCCSLSPSAC